MNTVVAMKAHGIITNHRESIFIGIASGFSIPIWIAWGLTAGLNRDHDQAQEFTDACMAFGLFITATLVLFSMFLPKVRQLVVYSFFTNCHLKNQKPISFFFNISFTQQIKDKHRKKLDRVMLYLLGSPLLRRTKTSMNLCAVK
jgi:hypothetical protein